MFTVVDQVTSTEMKIMLTFENKLTFLQVV